MASPEIDDTLAAFDKLAIDTTQTTTQECLPFNPPSARPDLAPIDRYLFRIFDHRTQGENSNKFMRSRGARLGDSTSSTDVFARTDVADVAAMLNRHLRWFSVESENDNLVSWTSSLLFALQYAIFRHSSDGTAFKDIKLCVVDTKGLPAKAFINDMDLISAFSAHDSNLASLRRLRNRQRQGYNGYYYFGEYLSQGSLQVEGSCSIVSVQDLIDCGLFSLRPELQNYGNQQPSWANKTIELRQIFFYKNPAATLDTAKVEAAMNIGDLFGGRWKLPVAAAFLSLQPYRKWINDICQLLAGVLRHDITESQAQEFSAANTRIVAPATLPELRQFEVIQTRIRAIWLLFDTPMRYRKSELLSELLSANAEAERAQKEV